MTLSKRTTSIVAALMLLFMFVITVMSIREDSLTMDEVAHLPSGYSYLTQRDMRLNPEHPPLIKDLSAVPLLFMNDIEFPSNLWDWTDNINGQWGFGYNFLYHMGNPAEKMIFWGRIPMILVLILLGFYVFKWTRELFGDKASLLALFLFVFSPTFLAHGRLVTTDVGAATGVFIGTYYFVRALKNPSWKNIVFAGIAFGIAELLKFSVILLIPMFFVLAFVWWVLKMGKLKTVLKTLVLTMVIGYIVLWPVYQYHVANYPDERQANDSEIMLGSSSYAQLRELIVWSADKPILKAYGQYMLGLALVFQRATGGHTTYFLGEVSASGWKNYFPTVYAIKETLVFHILSIIALLYVIWQTRKPFWSHPIKGTFEWLRNHFPEFSMLLFIAIYWATSLTSDLNIGVRHLLPVFPFVMILAAGMTLKWLKEPYLKAKYIFLGILILWQAFSVLSVYPHFLAYFNELVGGPDNGYIYTVDSNLDWGQDLVRLKKWVDEQGIDKIYVDYFGGSNAEYILKEKYAPWWGTRNPAEAEKGSYLAVSATFLQGGRGKPVTGFNQDWGYYLWLNQYEPVTKIGYSIFVYKIN